MKQIQCKPYRGKPTGTPPIDQNLITKIPSVVRAQSLYSVAGVTTGVGPFIALSSDPPPLCPRFLPGMWNPKEEDLLPGCAASAESPNREKRPFFLGFASSFKPTSSNFSSSVELALSKLVERMAGELRREKRESSEVREGAASWCVTGERAEMS